MATRAYKIVDKLLYELAQEFPYTKAPDKHELAFIKPKRKTLWGSRMVKALMAHPQNIFTVKIMHSIDLYLHNTKRLQYNEQNNIANKFMYYNVVPIMFLTQGEWNSLHRSYRKLFSQSICIGCPGMGMIHNKAKLTRLLNEESCFCATKQFYPRTYILPEDEKMFLFEQNSFCKQPKSSQNKQAGEVEFIIKPSKNDCGKGISLVTDKSDIDFQEFVVLQEYIKNPLLLNNHKFDLRLYIFIASLKPLQIYVYDEGLVRFAAVEYSQKLRKNNNIVNNNNILGDYMINGFNEENTESKRKINDFETLCTHLTNNSLNQNHASYQQQWSLEKFWKELEKKQSFANFSNLRCKQQKDFFKSQTVRKESWKQFIVSQVHDIVRNVFTVALPKLQSAFPKPFTKGKNHQGRCFEILGMDILIDANYKCWLLEINRRPSLMCQTEAAKMVKTHLINDIFKMLMPRIHCQQEELPVILSPSNTRFNRII